MLNGYLLLLLFLLLVFSSYLFSCSLFTIIFSLFLVLYAYMSSFVHIFWVILSEKPKKYFWNWEFRVCVCCAHKQEKTYLAIRMEIKIIKTKTTPGGEGENGIGRMRVSEYKKRSMILPNGLEQNTKRKNRTAEQHFVPKKIDSVCSDSFEMKTLSNVIN